VEAPMRHGLGQPVGQSNDKISVQYLYPGGIQKEFVDPPERNL